MRCNPYVGDIKHRDDSIRHRTVVKRRLDGVTEREKLYGSMLKNALIQESKGDIKASIADRISEIYSSDLDFNSSEVMAVMHKDVREIAKNILFRLKPECFIGER